MANKISGSDAMMKVLYDWHIDHIYGLPGGSFDSTMNAIYNWKNKIKYIQVRHEEAGALAASAEYKLTGKIAVAFGSAGPGAIHLMNGLYDAKYDHTPMLAIVANVPTSRQNIDFFQAFDEVPWFRDVAVWDHQAATKEALPAMIDEGIRQAYAKKGPAVVVVPKDYGWDSINDTFKVNYPNHVKPLYPMPDKKYVEEAVRLLEEAKSPMVYFGIGARDAAAELKEFSEKFKTPLASSVLAKGIVEDDYPAYMGSIGRVAPKTGVDLGYNTDLIVWVGNNVPFSIFLFNPKAKVIQIDIDSEKLGKRHHIDVPMLADAKQALRAIIDAGAPRDPSAFYKAALDNKENWEKWQESFVDSDEMPVRPEPIFDAINKAASDKAVFAVDVGNVNINFARLIKLHDDQSWTTSGLYATMGYGVPASLAGVEAFPDRDVYSLSGDGGFAMMSEEILTQAKYNMHVINVVFSNETLGYIEAEQTDDSHQPLSGVSLPDTDWAKVAEGMGATGFTVRTKAEMEDALAKAKAIEGPSVIDVKFTHEMPFTTEHMALDDAEFVEKYDAQALKPFSYFLKKYGDTLVDTAGAKEKATDAVKEAAEFEDDASTGASE